MKKYGLILMVITAVFLLVLSACTQVVPAPPVEELNAPDTPSPVDAAVGVALDVTLEWECNNPNKEGLTYSVFLSQTSGQLTKIAGDLEDKAYTPNFLQYNTKYYWRVEVKDAQGNNNRKNAISQEWEFTTMPDPYTPPAPPTNPTPPDGQTDVATSVTLSWEQANPDEKELMYDVYFGETSGDPIKIATGLVTPVLERSGLKYNTTYFWRVEVYDGHEVGTRSPRPAVSSEEWEFTTVRGPLGPLQPPTSPSPTDGATEVETTVTLSWEQEESEERNLRYAVYFGETSGSLEEISGDITATEFEKSGLEYNTTYYWRVEVYDVYGVFPEGKTLQGDGILSPRDLVTSDEWEFTTVAEPYTPPEPPTNPTPEDGQTDVATSVTLSWEQSNPEGKDLTYDVYFGETGGALTKIATDLTVTELEQTGLEYNTTYYWRVDVSDTAGAEKREIVSGEEWEFTTMEEPVEGPFSYEININAVWSFPTDLVQYSLIFKNVENGVTRLLLTGNGADREIQVNDNEAQINDYLVEMGSQNVTLKAYASQTLLWQIDIPLPQPMEVIDITLEPITPLYVSYIVSLRLNFNEITEITDFTDLNTGEFISFRALDDQVLETVPVEFTGESTSTTCTFKIYVTDISTTNGTLETDTSAYLEIEL